MPYYYIIYLPPCRSLSTVQPPEPDKIQLQRRHHIGNRKCAAALRPAHTQDQQGAVTPPSIQFKCINTEFVTKTFTEGEETHFHPSIYESTLFLKTDPHHVTLGLFSSAVPVVGMFSRSGCSCRVWACVGFMYHWTNLCSHFNDCEHRKSWQDIWQTFGISGCILSLLTSLWPLIVGIKSQLYQ